MKERNLKKGEPVIFERETCILKEDIEDWVSL
jgi:hypothetical protein